LSEGDVRLPKLFRQTVKEAASLLHLVGNYTQLRHLLT